MSTPEQVRPSPKGTKDPLGVNQMLSQLSYARAVGRGRLELPRLMTPDFESGASTGSATDPSL